MKGVTNHKEKRVFLFIHESPIVSSASSNGDPFTDCIALNIITGNALAYFSAFSIDFSGVGVDPVRISEMHCRNRKK